MSSEYASEQSNPLVSIAIPSYNHARYIKQCIESAISQDYANIELIIIDDGSSDESVHVIEALIPACRERFTRFEFRSRPNKGVCATYNEALTWVSGRYLAFLDSDDAMLPGKVSHLVGIMQSDDGLAGVFSGNECMDQDGVVYGVEYSAEAYFVFEDVIRHRHTFSTPGQLLRLSAIMEVGGYRDGMFIGDWYMWLKLTEAGYRLRNVPDILTRYRYHPGNSSRDWQKMFEARAQTLGHFRSHSLYPISMAVMCVWAAIDFSCDSKRRSLEYLIKAVASSWNILFTRYFLKGLLFLAMPGFLIGYMDSIKARWPQQLC